MTPKEKAEALIHRYSQHDILYWSLTKIQAKECALIAVDEIMDELVDIDDGQTIMPYKYWQNVKTEIQNL